MDSKYNFDEIRPLYDSELGAAFEQLIADEEFLMLAQKLFPQLNKQMVAMQLRSVHTKDDFQKKVISPLLQGLISKCTSGLTVSGLEHLDKNKAYLFVSNHRDIVLDPAFMNFLLLSNGFNTTEIAIGDNLLIKDWIRTLVRINKSFIIQRNAPVRQMMLILARQSAYIRNAITEREQSIWIAQREGRAKDANDRTQESLLKMFTLGCEGGFLDNVAQLNLCPVSISYEYDACDALKAKEFQQKRDDEQFKKSKQDDLLNMRQGILGYKGHIHFHFCGCVNDAIANFEGNRNEQVAHLAATIDKQIHANYRIFAANRVAYDLYKGVNKYESTYSAEERAAFEAYLEQKIASVDLPNKDEAFMKQKMLEMYANILINQENAIG